MNSRKLLLVWLMLIIRTNAHSFESVGNVSLADLELKVSGLTEKTGVKVENLCNSTNMAFLKFTSGFQISRFDCKLTLTPGGGFMGLLIYNQVDFFDIYTNNQDFASTFSMIQNDKEWTTVPVTEFKTEVTKTLGNLIVLRMLATANASNKSDTPNEIPVDPDQFAKYILTQIESKLPQVLPGVNNKTHEVWIARKGLMKETVFSILNIAFDPRPFEQSNITKNESNIEDKMKDIFKGTKVDLVSRAEMMPNELVIRGLGTYNAKWNISYRSFASLEYQNLRSIFTLVFFEEPLLDLLLRYKFDSFYEKNDMVGFTISLFISKAKCMEHRISMEKQNLLAAIAQRVKQLPLKKFNVTFEPRAAEIPPTTETTGGVSPIWTKQSVAVTFVITNLAAFLLKLA